MTSFLGQNVAYETLAQITKPWTLYLVSRFSKKTIFHENVAEDPAQLLAKTWCPYLFWVLRNLPRNFEKLANVTKSAKKNDTIWAPCKARAPKTGRLKMFELSKLQLFANRYFRTTLNIAIQLVSHSI